MDVIFGVPADTLLIVLLILFGICLVTVGWECLIYVLDPSATGCPGSNR
jgi:hypothetical protein